MFFDQNAADMHPTINEPKISVLTRTSCSQAVSVQKFRHMFTTTLFSCFPENNTSPAHAIMDLKMNISLPVSRFKNKSQGLFRLPERFEKTSVRKGRSKSHQTASASTYRNPWTWTWRVLMLILCECVDEDNNSTTLGRTTSLLTCRWRVLSHVADSRYFRSCALPLIQLPNLVLTKSLWYSAVCGSAI